MRNLHLGEFTFGFPQNGFDRPPFSLWKSEEEGIACSNLLSQTHDWRQRFADVVLSSIRLSSDS